jgi:cell division protein FtsB
MGFVVAIVALSMLAWVITTAIQAKHGYPLTDEWGNTIHPKGADDTTRALAAENAELKANIERLEDRLKVLERIATDPSRRLADDIDNLR